MPGDGNPEEESKRTILREHDPLGNTDANERELVLNALLTDYQAASEDARYRDRLINHTYYLAFVIGSLLLTGGITILLELSTTRPAAFLVLSMIGGFGAISFALLLVYVESFQDSRNSAWARRKEIESYLGDRYPGVVETNRSISESMNFQYEHKPDDQSLYANFSASVLTRQFLQIVMVILMITCLASLVVFWIHL